MDEEVDASGTIREGYYHHTRRPLNNLLLMLPMLAFFEVGASIYGTSKILLAPHYVSELLRYLGAPEHLLLILPAASIVVILIAQHFLHKDPAEFEPSVLAGMVGEAILWTVPLIAMSYVSARGAAGDFVVQQPPPEQAWEPALKMVLIAFGAGIYEEFIFRMVLITLIMLLLVDVFGLPKDVMTVVSVVAAAMLFSLCHFKQWGGSEPFQVSTFVFLAVAGTLWGSVFVFRGFAIAVGSHIVWDIFVFVT